LEPEEGARRVAHLIACGAPVERQAIRAEEIGVPSECVTQEGDLRTLPCHFANQDGLDGFFAARLVRHS
jgi:16S rRNA (cytosine967-C5)-methyltransferase